MNPLDDSATLFGRLRNACALEWSAYCEHEFVMRLGQGTLSREAFQHYLVQDYVFLIHFSRAWALAVYKAPTLADMRGAAQTLNALLNHEMTLHVGFCKGWGITLEQMEQAPEALANLAYTRYVLDKGLGGDFLDLLVALAPCVVGYAEIGRLLADQATRNNPYRPWIDLYAGDEYQQVAIDMIRQLDRIGGDSEARREADLVRNFRDATRLEVGFWDMALSQSG